MAKKLLLADDSITIQKVVELVLSEEDFQIKAVNNGQDALKQIEAFKPDIVLADIEMPQVNGYQLCEKIKQNQATSHIPVVLLAGAFEPLDDELAKNVGANGYIIKPFESQELISKVNAALTSVSIGGADVAVEVDAGGTLPEEVMEITDVPEQGAPHPAGIAEEDLWAMESPDTAEEAAGDVWELDESAAIDVSEEAGAGISEAPVFAEPEPFPEKTPAEPARVTETERDRSRDIRMTEPTPAGSTPEIPTPSSADMQSLVRDAVERQIAAAMANVNAAGIVQDALVSSVKGSLESVIKEMVPQALETYLKQALAESLSAVSKQVEKVIWETVPDLAETIIKKEIEKIKAET